MRAAAPHRAAGALARVTEDALRDATHDAFMALWRGAEGEWAELWAAYCEAQERYDAYLLRRS